MTATTKVLLALMVAFGAFEIGLDLSAPEPPTRNAEGERTEEHELTFKDFDDPGIGPLL